MILDRMLTDHQAGRDFFALAGNSVFEGYTERAGLFSRFADLWTAHADMMDEAVFPVLAEDADRSEALARLRDGQRRLRGAIADLARRAADETVANDHWFADFHRLKQEYEQQTELEQTLVVRMIQEDLSPDQIARMTHAGDRIRTGRGI